MSNSPTIYPLLLPYILYNNPSLHCIILTPINSIQQARWRWLCSIRRYTFCHRIIPIFESCSYTVLSHRYTGPVKIGRKRISKFEMWERYSMYISFDNFDNYFHYFDLIINCNYYFILIYFIFLHILHTILLWLYFGQFDIFLFLIIFWFLT